MERKKVRTEYLENLKTEKQIILMIRNYFDK